MFNGKIINSIVSQEWNQTLITFTDGEKLLIETNYNRGFGDYETCYYTYDAKSLRWNEVHKNNLK